MAHDRFSFSIREYTAKVRALDVTKCWPFTTEIEINKEQAEALLPPITITKFRWWSHQELAGGRFLVGIPRNEVEENLEIVCPVCENFMAASIKVVHNHVESCLAHAEREERRETSYRMKKSKSKSPKKRSILEIFAVSPQIEKVDGCLEEQADYKKKKKKIKNKINKALIATKLKSKIKRKKTKIKANKGNARKFKPSIPVDSSIHVNASFCNKGIVGNNMDGFIHRNKPRLKSYVKKQCGVKDSKSVVKQQKVAPVCGILKDNRELITRRDSDTWNMPGSSSSQAICYQVQHFDKHVRFSDKDDILDPKQTNCSFSDLSTYINDLAYQSEQDNSEESDKQTVAAAMYKSVDAHLSSRNGTELQTNIKQFPGTQHPIALLDFLRLHQEKEQQISDTPSQNRGMSHENNLPIFAQGSQNAPNNPIGAGILRHIPTIHEACPNLRSQVCANISVAPNSRGNFEDQTSEFAASTKSYAQPSSASGFGFIGSANRKPSIMTQSSIKSIGEQQAFLYQPYGHVSPLVAPEMKQRVRCLSERCTDGEFYGLPLNSHGELVQLGSGDRVGFNQLKKSTMQSSRTSLLPRSLANFVHEKHPTWQDVPKGKSNLQNMHKNHNIHLPARFGVTEFSDVGIVDAHLRNYERGSNISSYLLDSISNMTSISSNQCGQYDHIQSCEGVHLTHLNESLENMSLKTAAPTMRLMGKDVAIGRSDAEVQGFEGGKFWIGKAIVPGHYPIINAFDALSNIPIQQDRIDCRALERSMDMLPPSLEIESSRALQNNFQMKVQGRRSSHPCLDALQNNGLALDRNAGYHSPVSLCTPFLKLQREPNLQESFIPSAKSLGMHRQQNLLSGRRFPFLHPDCSEHVSSSSTSENLPPWLLGATIQGKPASMPCFALAEVDGRHYPFATTGPDFPTTLNRSSVLSRPHSCAISDPNSLGSALFVQPPIFPFSHGSSSSMIMSNGSRINVEDRMNIQKIKRPAAVISSDMFRPVKRPNLIQEDLSSVIEVPRNNCGSEIYQNFDWDAGCRPPNQSQKDRLGTSNGIDSFKAKHILKPNWNKVEDNSRLIQ